MTDLTQRAKDSETLHQNVVNLRQATESLKLTLSESKRREQKLHDAKNAQADTERQRKNGKSND